jgi:hypothetical protein
MDHAFPCTMPHGANLDRSFLCKNMCLFESCERLLLLSCAFAVQLFAALVNGPFKMPCCGSRACTYQAFQLQGSNADLLQSMHCWS